MTFPDALEALTKLRASVDDAGIPETTRYLIEARASQRAETRGRARRTDLHARGVARSTVLQRRRACRAGADRGGDPPRGSPPRRRRCRRRLLRRASRLQDRDAARPRLCGALTRKPAADARPGGAGQPMPDGRLPAPGGWNRLQIEVSDLDREVEALRDAGASFRNDLVTGQGGSQILLEDHSGNPIELFQPADA